MNLNLTFTYKIDDVLTALRKYREEHVQEYKDAVAAYKKKMLAHLSSMIGKVENGKRVSHSFPFQPPVNQLAEYDNLIDQFSRTTDKEVKLNDQQFRSIFKNEWHFVHNFKSITMSYGVSGASGPAGSAGTSGVSGGDEDETEGEDLLSKDLK